MMQQNLPGVKLAPRVLISGPSMRLWTLMVSLPAWDPITKGLCLAGVKQCYCKFKIILMLNHPDI